MQASTLQKSAGIHTGPTAAERVEMFNSVSMASSEMETLAALLEGNIKLVRELETLLADLEAAPQADQEVVAELRNATKYALETSASIKVGLQKQSCKVVACPRGRVIKRFFRISWMK